MAPFAGKQPYFLGSFWQEKATFVGLFYETEPSFCGSFFRGKTFLQSSFQENSYFYVGKTAIFMGLFP